MVSSTANPMTILPPIRLYVLRGMSKYPITPKAMIIGSRFGIMANSPKRTSPMARIINTVISRNPVDGAEVSHFKITSIENGKLFHNNEVDEILNNSFITYAQASAGLKFAPSIGINNNGSFKVQAATGPQNNKLGGNIIIANIVIDNDPPTILTFPTDTIVEITEPFFYQVIASDPNELDQLTFTIQIPEFIKAWMVVLVGNWFCL